MLIISLHRLGADINDHYNIHKGVFLKFKGLLWEARKNYDDLVRMQHMKGPTIATFIEMIKVVDMKGQTRTEYIED